MANNLIKVILTGAQIVGRSFARAVRKEFAAAEHAAQKAGGGEKGKQSATTNSLFGMTIDEAQQILNVNNIHDEEKVLESYNHLMKVNEGQSLYLQSKVFRAKERIDAEKQIQSNDNNNDNSSSSS